MGAGTVGQRRDSDHEPVMDSFLNRAGEDMNRIHSELDKLISYLGERKGGNGGRFGGDMHVSDYREDF